MSDTVIRVENLSKKYVIGHQKQERYISLRDVISDKVKSFGQVLSRKDPQEDPTHEEFWALKDVSFEIKQGDRVGIIGRNGAGKSTLLKILSRITEPTEGRISINGRVASLLEVGTGFHPELTGRENIFLNGAILGMDRVEIKRKFDEIVAFAEVEKFLDTPVKRYSSGMYVRLAFAVAAHLEPEILIVDEVLAVGDAQFQKKCLGKMEDVAEKEGRTILFVSHNMAAVLDLCSKGIVLEGGKIIQEGTTENSVKTYMNSWQTKSIGENTNIKDRLNRTSGDVRFTHLIMEDNQGNQRWEFSTDESLKIKFSYHVVRPVSNLMIFLALKCPTTDQILTNYKHTIANNDLLIDTIGTGIIEIPNPNLRPGNYAIYSALGNTETPYTPYDVIDINVNIPYLTITSDEPDPHKRVGYFTTFSQLHLEHN